MIVRAASKLGARVGQAEVVEGLERQAPRGRVHRMVAHAAGVAVGRDEAVQGVAHQADVAGTQRQSPVQAEGDMARDRPGRIVQPLDRRRQGLRIMGVQEQGLGPEPTLQHLAERASGALRDVHEEQGFGPGLGRGARIGRGPTHPRQIGAAAGAK